MREILSAIFLCSKSKINKNHKIKNGSNRMENK